MFLSHLVCHNVVRGSPRPEAVRVECWDRPYIQGTGVGGKFVRYPARLSGPVLGPRTRNSIINTFFIIFSIFAT